MSIDGQRLGTVHIYIHRLRFPMSIANLPKSSTSRMLLIRSLFKLSLASLALAESTVYLIRHGEKPADGGTGLNAQGVQRSQCLRNVFGSSSDYDIGYILAQTPKSSK